MQWSKFWSWTNWRRLSAWASVSAVCCVSPTWVRTEFSVLVIAHAGDHISPACWYQLWANLLPGWAAGPSPRDSIQLACLPPRSWGRWREAHPGHIYICPVCPVCSWSRLKAPEYHIPRQLPTQVGHGDWCRSGQVSAPMGLDRWFLKRHDLWGPLCCLAFGSHPQRTPAAHVLVWVSLLEVRGSKLLPIPGFIRGPLTCPQTQAGLGWQQLACPNVFQTL